MGGKYQPIKHDMGYISFSFNINVQEFWTKILSSDHKPNMPLHTPNKN